MTTYEDIRAFARSGKAAATYFTSPGAAEQHPVEDEQFVRTATRVRERLPIWISAIAGVAEEMESSLAESDRETGLVGSVKREEALITRRLKATTALRELVELLLSLDVFFARRATSLTWQEIGNETSLTSQGALQRFTSKLTKGGAGVQLEDRIVDFKLVESVLQISVEQLEGLFAARPEE